MALPSGVETNDLLLLFVAHGGSLLTVVPPDDWTTLEDGTLPNNDPRADVYYTKYNNQTTLSFSMNSSDGSAILAAFRVLDYGTKGTLQNSSNDTVTTSKTSALLFMSLQNGGNETPALPPGFISIGLGNGNMRSMRVGYLANQPADIYLLTPVAAMGEIMPSGTLALALY